MIEKENQVVPEVLNDGKFPWKERKMKNLRLSDIYQYIGYEEYGQRAQYCSTWLQYFARPDGVKELANANFCKLRLCPLCTARRARKAAWNLSQIMNKVQADHDGTSYIFLTLTVKNCDGSSLGSALSLLATAWDKLVRQRPVRRAWSGWFRAVEITRRGRGYHPHIHAIIAVTPDYFDRSKGLYLTHDELVTRWQKALRVDYKPSVRISKTKSKGDRHDADKDRAAALEAAKYATKSDEYVDPKLSMEMAAEIVADYTKALHHRRLTAFGGWMKEAARALNAEDVKDNDLIHTDNDTIRADVAELIEEYRWSFGAGDYILASRRVNPLRVVYEDVQQNHPGNPEV